MESYFTYENKKYAIVCQNRRTNIYKIIDNRYVSLSEEEIKEIYNLLYNNGSYIYSSELLNNIVLENPEIEDKDYMMNFLNWLEKIIPENSRENFYSNLKTLQTNLNREAQDTDVKDFNQTAGYNASNNSITMNKEALDELKRISEMSSNPKEFFEKHYAQTLMHELAHMASSKFNPETQISHCGFDTYPPQNDEERNRGLTEGFTEAVAMAGVPGTVEQASGYYFEASLVNQLFYLVGIEVLSESYFSNLGIKPVEDKLNKIISDPNKSYDLFRKIELNYMLREIDGGQTLLGDLQNSMLDYLEKKIENLSNENKNEEVNKLLANYELSLITPEKLAVLKKNPNNYIGINDNIERFNNLKEKYSLSSKVI